MLNSWYFKYVILKNELWQSSIIIKIEYFNINYNINKDLPAPKYVS